MIPISTKLMKLGFPTHTFCQLANSQTHTFWPAFPNSQTRNSRLAISQLATRRLANPTRILASPLYHNFSSLSHSAIYEHSHKSHCVFLGIQVPPDWKNSSNTGPHFMIIYYLFNHKLLWRYSLLQVKVKVIRDLPLFYLSMYRCKTCHPRVNSWTH